MKLKLLITEHSYFIFLNCGSNQIFAPNQFITCGTLCYVSSLHIFYRHSSEFFLFEFGSNTIIESKENDSFKWLKGKRFDRSPQHYTYQSTGTIQSSRWNLTLKHRQDASACRLTQFAWATHWPPRNLFCRVQFQSMTFDL